MSEKTSWRLLHTWDLPGARNMAIDEAIQQAHRQGRVPPTLRFYTWRPACLSIGAFQSMKREVNVEACRQMGFDLVRRPTGGRAILHDRELTYSVVVREDNPFLGGSIVESYQKISAGILAGLASLGLSVKALPKVEPNGDRSFGSAACFASTSHYEVTVNEGKLVGSAQMRSRAVILQHGSILLDVDLDLLACLLQPHRRGGCSRSLAELSAHVGTVKAALGREIGPEQLADALCKGFEEIYSIEFVPGQLLKEELESAALLEAEKYGADSWNLRR